MASASNDSLPDWYVRFREVCAKRMKTHSLVDEARCQLQLQLLKDSYLQERERDRQRGIARLEPEDTTESEWQLSDAWSTEKSTYCGSSFVFPGSHSHDSCSCPACSPQTYCPTSRLSMYTSRSEPDFTFNMLKPKKQTKEKRRSNTISRSLPGQKADPTDGSELGIAPSILPALTIQSTNTSVVVSKADSASAMMLKQDKIPRKLPARITDGVVKLPALK